MTTSHTISIGEVRISLTWDPGAHSVKLAPVLSGFLAAPGNGSTISLRIEKARTVDLDRFTLVFDNLAEGLWRIWKSRESNDYLITLHRVVTDGSVYRFALANDTFTEFRLGEADHKGSFDPLEYPLNDLMVSGYLNLNRVGIFLHSALVSLGGRGCLFTGTSGAGKSTISELWLKDKQAQVLTDERVIIREKAGRLHAFGTPWHGTAAIHRNQGAPLEKIFFIRHGKENTLKKLTQADAAQRLMVRCFPTFWNKSGLGFALDFCARLAGGIGCYEFGFVPDQSAVDYIKTHIGNGAWNSIPQERSISPHLLASP